MNKKLKSGTGLFILIKIFFFKISTLIFFRGFKQDCPDGQLGKDKILEMYSMILPVGNAQEKNT